MDIYHKNFSDSTIEVETFDPHQICFSIGAAEINENNLIIKIRFIGSAILLDSENGTIITCSHLCDSLKENEKLCLSTNKENYILNDVRKHPSIDLMTASVNTRNLESLINFKEVINKKPIDQMHLGLEVRAYGYISKNPNAQKPIVDIEIRQGYICRSNPDEKIKEVNGNSRIELSFSSPKGFSGAPLLLKSTPHRIIPIGMLYNNSESQVSRWEISETRGEKLYEEKKLRIEEHSLVHSIDDIELALKDLGIIK